MIKPFRTWLEKTPALAAQLFPQLHWRIPTSENKIYLTFDDGPHPEYTPAVLDLLDQLDVRATFFVIGKHAQAHPEIIERIAEKHCLGNHTWDHLRLRGKSFDELAQQIEPTGESLFESTSCETNLLRPPYGIVGRNLIEYARRNDLRIIMWDILPWDFLPQTTAEEISRCLIQKPTPGSIIVLHDGHSCAPKMMQALRTSIPKLRERGFEIEVLPSLLSRSDK